PHLAELLPLRFRLLPLPKGAGTRSVAAQRCLTCTGSRSLWFRRLARHALELARERPGDDVAPFAEIHVLCGEILAISEGIRVAERQGAVTFRGTENVPDRAARDAVRDGRLEARQRQQLRELDGPEELVDDVRP